MKNAARLYSSTLDIAKNSAELLELLEHWGHNVEHLKGRQTINEDINAYARMWRATMSPAQKDSYLARKRYNYSQRIARMSSDERRAFWDKEHIRYLRFIMTPEKLNMYNANRRERQREKRRSRSDEAKALYVEKDRLRNKRYFDNMTPEQRARYLDRKREYNRRKRATMSEAERLRVREQDRIRAARKRLLAECDVAPVTEQTAPFVAEPGNA